jgi:peptidyl-prolyl cis-trans isomerase SurA
VTRFVRAALLLLAFAAPAAAEEVDRIVAIVDETPILESEVRAELEVFAADPAADSLPPGELRELAIQRLVDDRILLSKAKAAGLAPSGEEIEEALDGSIERMRAQLGSESAFLAALQAEGLTLEALRKRYRSEIEKSLTVRMLIEQEVRPKVDVTDADVRKFFDEHAEELPLLPERLSISQIFLKPAASAEAESAAVRELASIRERALAGESFEELARTSSDDPSASRGGDLGFFGRGDMDPAFEAAAFGLASPGDVSGVVKSRFGYHLIQLVERKDERVHARHILKTLAAGEEGREEARRLGEALLDSLRAGADFGRLARRESDDRSSAVRGGEVGVFSLEDMTVEVRSILEGLQPGEISSLVEATDGFHIFRLLERLPEGRPSFEEAREQARAAAKSERQQEALQAYIAELRKEIYVRRVEPAAAE